LQSLEQQVAERKWMDEQEQRRNEAFGKYNSIYALDVR